MVLCGVHYVIDAHSTMTDKAGPDATQEKHYAILLRRLRNGQCFHQPCFGSREFPANFRLFENGEMNYGEAPLSSDLGPMPYDMDFFKPSATQPTFFRARVENGVITAGDCEVFR